MSENYKIHRRKMIAGLGAGLTSVVAAPVFAAGSPYSEDAAPAGIEDLATN